MKPPDAEVKHGHQSMEDRVISKLKEQLAERDNQIRQLHDEVKKKNEEIMQLSQKSATGLPFSVGKIDISLK